MEPLVGTSFNKVSQLSDYWKNASKVWVQTIETICCNFGYSDAPWEYLERTNSNILAGSLTACGAPAMPESYVMRQGVAEQQSQRVDICLVTRNEEVTNIELVECKLAEYDASQPITAKKVVARLKDASTQVKNIIGLNGIKIADFPVNARLKHTVVVIGLPFFQPQTPHQDIMNGLQQVIKDLKTEQSFDVVAWCFPDQYLDRPARRWGPKVYPGTFLAAKVG